MEIHFGLMMRYEENILNFCYGIAYILQGGIFYGYTVSVKSGQNQRKKGVSRALKIW